MTRSTRSTFLWRRAAPAGAVVLAAAAIWCAADEKSRIPGAEQWTIHDMNRPKPPVVTPGTAGTQEQAGTAPSDAVVLFDGKDMSKWASGAGEAKAKVENGAFVMGGGDVQTKDGFGDCQLHVEWMAPTPPKGESQGRGNSGVFLMGRYEVQVLDSFKSDTYADGQAGALYGQYPPLVNASREPGQWQTYDIIFHRPHFGPDGKATKPATVTVLHNGVLVQDHSELIGPSGHKNQPEYSKHGDKEPIRLQDHGDPVRYRNIWIRPLEGQQPAAAAAQPQAK